MQNLLPISDECKSIFDGIAHAKRSPRKDILQAIKNVVHTRYNIFEQNKHSLENIQKITFSDDKKDALLHCYENSTTSLDKLKTKIKEKQNNIARATCQYCGLNTPDTFDHYLPKSEYPEFSVMPLNLLPCCQTCNGKKSDNWFDNILSTRTILNLYFDALPSERYLYATIRYEDDIPIVSFKLVNTENAINEYLFNIIQRHYSDLDLVNRYIDKANSVITNIENSLVCHSITGFSNIKEWLKEEVVSKQNTFGLNYWKAAIIEALSDTDEFIDKCLSNS